MTEKFTTEKVDVNPVLDKIINYGKKAESLEARYAVALERYNDGLISRAEFIVMVTQYAYEESIRHRQSVERDLAVNKREMDILSTVM